MGSDNINLKEYSRAVERNIAELHHAILEQITINGIGAATGVSHPFLHIVYNALFNDFISHCIKVFDEDHNSATFWFLYGNAHKFIEDNCLEQLRAVDIGPLKKVKKKLKLIRNKTHFHIDRERVVDPKAVWKDASITGNNLKEAVDIAWNVVEMLRIFLNLEERHFPAGYNADLVKKLSMVIDKED